MLKEHFGVEAGVITSYVSAKLLQTVRTPLQGRRFELDDMGPYCIDLVGSSL